MNIKKCEEGYRRNGANCEEINEIEDFSRKYIEVL